MEFGSTEGEQKYAALVRAAADAVVGLDFDGTLSPIVEDPSSAHIHADAADVLVALAQQVRAVAVITGRPARQALDLGGLEAVGNAIGDAGKELFVFGQYGNERWSSTNRRVISPRPPAGLASFLRELPRFLRRAGAEDAHVEEKGLAVAVHTRRMADPERAEAVLLPLLRDLAGSHDLVVEPGRNVVEIRSPGMHKGLAVNTLAEEVGASAFCFVGDDLGDLEAFEAVAALAKARHADPARLLRIVRAVGAGPPVGRRRARPRRGDGLPAPADGRRGGPSGLTGGIVPSPTGPTNRTMSDPKVTDYPRVRPQRTTEQECGTRELSPHDSSLAPGAVPLRRRRPARDGGADLARRGRAGRRRRGPGDGRERAARSRPVSRTATRRTAWSRRSSGSAG